MNLHVIVIDYIPVQLVSKRGKQLGFGTMLLYRLGFRSVHDFVHASSRTCQNSLRPAKECKRLSDGIQMRETTRNSLKVQYL